MLTACPANVAAEKIPPALVFRNTCHQIIPTHNASPQNAGGVACNVLTPPNTKKQYTVSSIIALYNNEPIQINLFFNQIGYKNSRTTDYICNTAKTDVLNLLHGKSQPLKGSFCLAF